MTSYTTVLLGRWRSVHCEYLLGCRLASLAVGSQISDRWIVTHCVSIAYSVGIWLPIVGFLWVIRGRITRKKTHFALIDMRVTSDVS